MRPLASEKIPLLHRIVRLEVSERAVALLLGAAQVLSEGERCDEGRRYLGSTLVTVDLAPLAHRFSEPLDPCAAELLASIAPSDGALSRALWGLALAEAGRRLCPGHALTEATVEIRGVAQGMTVSFHLDVDGRVVERVAPPPATFDAKEVEAILGIPRRRLRAWAHAGFLPPSAAPRYTFLDLVRLKAAWGLVSAGASLQRVRAALRGLAAQLPDEPDPLCHLRIVALGDTIVVRWQEGTFEADSGQHLLEFDVAELCDEATRLRPIR
jgi:DNA-binding transcriptional MerR regulator